MSVYLLTEHHLEFLSLQGGCTGSSESTLVKIPHCWNSHAAAQFTLKQNALTLSCLMEKWPQMHCIFYKFPVPPTPHTNLPPPQAFQGSHRLEKYLNIQGCLEKTLKIKFTLKSTGKTLKGLEKSLNFTIYRRIQHCLWRSKSV